MVSFQIVPRNTPLTESAAPARARQNTAPPRVGGKPNAIMASLHMAAAMITAAPRRCTFVVQPLKSVVNGLPSDIAEYSHPAAGAPPQFTAMAGKSAIGMANVIATIST